ncbi:hypothetical protein ACS0TY_007004 [Phlomoides rotata]
MRELGGLVDHKYVSVEEQTVSHYVHLVLKVVLKLHTIFIVKPAPVHNDSTDPRWKWFKMMFNVEKSDEDVNDGEQVEYVEGVDSSPEWNLMREELTISMFNEYKSRS